MTRLRFLFLLLTCWSAALLAQTVPWTGGPVIQNARIITIFWGTPDPTFRTSVDRFYSQIAPSSYLNRLSEYSTGAVKPSSQTPFRNWFGYPSEQVIGTGTSVGSYIIQPTQTGNVETTDIGPQLDHEIHVGHIPGPDRNTIYMVHFSKSMIVYDGTNILGFPVGPQTGVLSGGKVICGYHSSYYSDFTNRAIVFGAVPNQGALPNCSTKVGLSPIHAETMVASHELLESITDPGAAVIEGAPLTVGLEFGNQAWIVPKGFLGIDSVELGDLCENSPDNYIDLLTSPSPLDDYYVATSWSNRLGACVASGPVGNLDTTTTDQLGFAHIRGWSVDPYSAPQSIQVHVYFDGPYPYGKGYAVMANYPRGDIRPATGYLGYHGFDLVVPQELRDGRTHSVYAYGIGIIPGNNALLGNVPISFSSSLPNAATQQPLMIASAQGPGQCLDLTGGSTIPSTPVQVYTCLGNDNQRFTYHPDTGQIRTYNDSQCLDASGGAGRDGDRIILWPCNGGSNQRWTFNFNNGEIRGINGRCIDANARSVANGSAVQIWTCNGGTNQSWFRK